jgi:hypothetical protein
MRLFVAVLCMVCSASAAMAQSSPQQQAQDQSRQAQLPPQQSAWQAQFSGSNWSISETRLEPLLVRFEMKMNRFYSGGAGEANLVFRRRAEAIMRAGDFANYEVVDYRESLNSFIFGGQRIVEATIRLIPRI